MFISFDPANQLNLGEKKSENIAFSVSLCLFSLFPYLLSSTPHLINCVTSQPADSHVQALLHLHQTLANRGYCLKQGDGLGSL